jgi:hypothetical protein
MKPPPRVLEEEEPPGVPEEESPGVEEEERCSGPPTSSPSHPMKPTPCARGRSGAAATGAYHLVVRGRRSGAAAAGASHLVARGRSKSPIAVSGLPLHELRMLANYG